MKKHIKVAVSGAAGQIGYALLFRIASGQMFGENTEVDLHLLELQGALKSLEGVRMELEDCAFPLLKNIICTSDLNVAMKEVNWALLVGAVPRKAGMERSDLLKINGNIFVATGKALDAFAAPDIRVLVVGNPCNTNGLIAMNQAKRIPSDRFYAMTMLDEKRAIAQLAIKAKVSVNDVSDMIIWGNHSATQFPDFLHAKIKGQFAGTVITDHHWLENDFIAAVQQRGAEIIKARGFSSAASAANAIVSTVNQLLDNTTPEKMFSLCQCSRGEYRVDEGLIFSFPCQAKDGKVVVIENIEHGEFAQQKLKATLDELRAEKEAVKAMGLLK